MCEVLLTLSSLATVGALLGAASCHFGVKIVIMSVVESVDLPNNSRIHVDNLTKCVAFVSEKGDTIVQHTEENKPKLLVSNCSSICWLVAGKDTIAVCSVSEGLEAYSLDAHVIQLGISQSQDVLPQTNSKTKNTLTLTMATGCNVFSHDNILGVTTHDPPVMHIGKVTKEPQKNEILIKWFRIFKLAKVPTTSLLTKTHLIIGNDEGIRVLLLHGNDSMPLTESYDEEEIIFGTRATDTREKPRLPDVKSVIPGGLLLRAGKGSFIKLELLSKSLVVCEDETHHLFLLQIRQTLALTAIAPIILPFEIGLWSLLVDNEEMLPSDNQYLAIAPRDEKSQEHFGHTLYLFSASKILLAHVYIGQDKVIELSRSRCKKTIFLNKPIKLLNSIPPEFLIVGHADSVQIMLL